MVGVRAVKRLVRLLARVPAGHARGGQISMRREGDSVPFLLSEGRVWRLVDAQPIEADDLLTRKINKLRNS